MPKNKVGRCQGKNKNGMRCKRRVARGYLCFQHLASEKQLKIKKSHIPNAGLGLYSLKDRNAGSIIIPYGGITVKTTDPDYGGDYILQIAKDKFLDGNPKKTNKSIGAYANDCRTANKKAKQCKGNNAKLANRSANLKATKKIKAGQEIYAGYGRSYW
jgi:uncharacterized protein